jgi:uncharacterized alpha-E superfamily protein
VILNPDFPRSLTYCVNGMQGALDRIGTPPTGAVREAMAALRAHLTGITPKAILDRGLHEYLDDFLALLAGLTAALQSEYFEAHLSDADEVEVL